MISSNHLISWPIYVCKGRPAKWFNKVQEFFTDSRFSLPTPLSISPFALLDRLQTPGPKQSTQPYL